MSRAGYGFSNWVTVLAACALVLAPSPAAARIRKAKSDLGQVLSRMNEAAKHLKTVTAGLDYTTVNVLVDDHSTDTGRFFLRNPKSPEVLIRFEKPDPKTFLYKHSHAEIYYPKINRIEEYDLSNQSQLIQTLLLLGFGTEINALKADYSVTLSGEEDLEGESTAVLELTPKNQAVASQLTKIQMWVSEDSWIPAQQKFFETSGDYLVAHYTDVKVNRDIPSSTFSLDAAPGVQRVKKR